jgi:hypothetical protein
VLLSSVFASGTRRGTAVNVTGRRSMPGAVGRLIVEARSASPATVGPTGVQIVAPFGRDAFALEIARRVEALAPPGELMAAADVDHATASWFQRFASDRVLE